MQGLVGAVFEGVGVSAGSFIGGWLMNNYGGSITFRIFGISAILLAFVHYAVQWILSKRVDEIGKKLVIDLSPEKYTSNGAHAYD